MGRVTIAPYDPAWPGLYEEEAVQLRSVFHSRLKELHHIGSTAVPGSDAKPVIDIMAVFTSLAASETIEISLCELGYSRCTSTNSPGRLFFRKRSPVAFHLHIFPEGSKDITRHLALRDYLRAHPARRKAYAGLKKSLAWEYPFNMSAYAEGKHDYVKELECRALRWYRSPASKRRG
ncbi:GrpB family protein [Alkalicoccus luteus]|uniref:GrpB family protein n=1 Tax=Alkalicoccus luteus TaxID=1237094 RepID=A0A969TWY3_9BACI|nr:GrpB family protein [Alkalicoccus luteus]NJP37719.1 GrpB family protein [Alkalicoccus luteus]